MTWEPLKRERGYILPETIDPEAHVCIRAYVPDDPLYIAAFWGSYDFLATWLAWERDTAKRGKDAATVWRPLFEQSRDEWLLGAGSCYPPSVPAEEDAWDELADLLWFYKETIQHIDDWLTGGKSTDTVKAYLSWVINGSAGWADLIDDMADHTPAERDAAIADIDWEEAYEAVYCYELTCETLWATSFYEWLNCTAEAIFDYLDSQAGWLYDQLNGTIAALSSPWVLGDWAASSYGGGAGFGFGEPACPFVSVFDFSLGELGWAVTQHPNGFWQGEHDGFKWIALLNTGTGQWEIAIDLPFDSTELTSISVSMNCLGGANWWIQHGGVRPSPYATTLASGYASGVVVRAWSGSQTTTRIRVALSASTAVSITSITVAGKGEPV